MVQAEGQRPGFSTVKPSPLLGLSIQFEHWTTGSLPVDLLSILLDCGHTGKFVSLASVGIGRQMGCMYGVVTPTMPLQKAITCINF
jgi:hypothetical protein